MVKLRWVPICAVLLFGVAQAQPYAPTGIDHKTGSICILPNSPEKRSRISPLFIYNPDTLTIRIDKRQPIPWPHANSVLIDELDLRERHLVLLTSDGKPIQSFRFSFSEVHNDDAKLCIYFDGYQGIQLENDKKADWCRVKVCACGR